MRIIINPVEADLVRRAFEGSMETRSYPAVVFDLECITGRPWTIQTATRLIENDVYRAVQRFGQWASEKAHEAKEKFVRDCIGACAKVMNLDRFDLAR